MAIIGIDLGTSNTLACVFQNGRAELIPNAEGGYLTKSVVSILEDGEILTGREAKERLITHPECTAASYKVHMGTEWETVLGGELFRPEELSAIVLKQIKRDAERFLGEDVKEAVISVPAYFNDNQRCATKLAAELAGLKVLRLINEPSAAAVYYRYKEASAKDGKLMIIDFGGGTLDVSIVDCFENIIEIVGIAGDNHLGGDDIDRAVAEYFLKEKGLSLKDLSKEEQAELLFQAERAKLELSEPGAEKALIRLSIKTGVYEQQLNQELMAELCVPVFKRVEKVLRRALGNKEAAKGIEKVVLVGGSSKLLAFQSFLEKLMSAKPVVAADPDRIVALGAGVCAGIKERREELKDIVMTDVCPFSLGVATYNNRVDNDPHMAVLIPRSSMLPVSCKDRFFTLNDGQYALHFDIYQGEDYYVSGNLKLGELDVRVPRGPAGSQWAEVTFTYDIDGILHVEVKASGGDRKEKVILNPNLRLSGEELKKAMEHIKEVRLSSGTEDDSKLFQQALSLYKQLEGKSRAALGAAIEGYSMARDSNDVIIICRERKRLMELTKQFTKEMEENPFLQLNGIGFGSEESM